jgi:hypothetical protein
MNFFSARDFGRKRALFMGLGESGVLRGVMNLTARATVLFVQLHVFLSQVAEIATETRCT